MKARTMHVTDQHSISQRGSTRNRILALDPANITGWAVLEVLGAGGGEASVAASAEASVVATGVFKARGRTTARRLASAFEWCQEMLGSHCADVLAIEVPYLATHRDRQGRKRRNVQAFRQQCRLGGVYLLAAGELGVKVVEVIPAQRLTAIGLPGNLCRAAAKAQVLLCVNAIYGLALTDHNAADAVAVGVAAVRVLRERKRVVVGEG